MMKTMLLTLIKLIFFQLTGWAQPYYPFSTPNGTTVYIKYPGEAPPGEIAEWNEFCIKEHPFAEFISDASDTYNCHGYAWIMLPGGPTCWLGDDLEYAFWLDDSYIETTNPAEADVIHYPVPNFGHSAVRVDNSGMYISKWGSMSLMKHYP